MFHIHHGGITEMDTAHFKEPIPAHHIYCGYVIRHMNWLGFNRAPDASKTSDPEPPPTCPFICTNNVKKRKIPTPKLTLFVEGDPDAWFLMTTAPRHQVARRCGENPSRPTPHTRQTLFTKIRQSMQKEGGLASAALRPSAACLSQLSSLAPYR